MLSTKQVTLAGGLQRLLLFKGEVFLEGSDAAFQEFEPGERRKAQPTPLRRAACPSRPVSKSDSASDHNVRLPRLDHLSPVSRFCVSSLGLGTPAMAACLSRLLCEYKYSNRRTVAVDRDSRRTVHVYMVAGVVV